MSIEQLMDSLRKLNRYEEAGKAYLSAYGTEMDYVQLHYLMTHGDEPELLKKLRFAGDYPEQQEIRKKLHTENEAGLSEQGFMEKNKNVELEQLLRYVSIPQHKHRFIELVCVIEGTCTHTIGNHGFIHKAGDFTVIPPDISHVLRAEPDCVCLTSKMRVSTFKDCFSDILQNKTILSAYLNESLSVPYYRCALTMHAGNDEYFRETILRMYKQQSDNLPLSAAIIEHLWIVLFSYLVQNYSETAEFLVLDSVAHAEMITILNYIFEHYSDITLTDTAEHFHYSVPYLSRTIREQTGKTFSSLLQNYRLERAAEQLEHTEKKVEDICFDVGYKNVSQFIRLFRNRFGITPYRYRKENMPSPGMPHLAQTKKQNNR